MVATTKTASRRETSSAPKSQSAERAGAAATFEPMPDIAEWIKTTFYAGDGPAVPPAVAMMRANPFMAHAERVIDGMAQMQAEMARFGARRIHRALEAQAEMLACRSPSELQAARAVYMERLADDYAHEWSRLLGYGMRVGMGQPLPQAPDPEDERHATPV